MYANETSTLLKFQTPPNVPTAAFSPLTTHTSVRVPSHTKITQVWNGNVIFVVYIYESVQAELKFGQTN